MHNMSHHYSFLSGAYHLAYYFPRNHGNPDKVSDYILSFKDNKEPYTSKWIALATREIKNNISSIDLVVRVLSSTELTATGSTSLDRLGATVSKYTNSKYEKTALRKTRHTQSLKFLSKADRQREINGSYVFNMPSSIFSNTPKILLIDDIVTSGTTIREVNRAIKEKLPNCSLFFFTIGKTHSSGDVHNRNILREFRKSDKEIFFNSNQYSNESVQMPTTTSPASSLDDTLVEMLDGIDSEPSPPSPNLIKISDGKWKPADGYTWKDVNDPDDLTVVKDTSPLTRQGEKWTIREEEMLVELVVDDLMISEISSKLNRSMGGIKAKIGRLAYGSRLSVGSVYVKPEIVEQWKRKINGETTSLRVKGKPSLSYVSSSSSKSSDAPCFIATAVYQNSNHPVVNDFRLFRDTCMIGNNWGEFIIQNYYKYSPKYAQKLNKSRVMRRIVLVVFIKPIHFFITKFPFKGSN